MSLTTDPDPRMGGLVITTPVGPLTLTASTRGLTQIRFGRFELTQDSVGLRHLSAANVQLEEYFAGRRKDFDLPLDVRGTPFQMQVWTLLATIPYGQTTTYGELATRLGDVKLARAVGRANGANPVPIVRPCHRVIGQNGQLVGFGGGLDKKVLLLQHESSQIPLFHL